MSGGKPVPNRIRELRTSLGLSQKKLAQAIGVSDTAIQNYEYQKRRLPGDTLSKLADFFDVSTDYILMVTDDPKRYGSIKSYARTGMDELSPDEEELIGHYRSMDDSDRETLLNTARRFAAFAGEGAERSGAVPANHAMR